jgi:hypothetical protein
MKKFKIEVKETLSRIIEINANSIDEALENVQQIYKNEKIILDNDDFVEVDFINHIDSQNQ